MAPIGFRQEALLLLRFVGEAGLAAGAIIALGWWLGA